MTALNTLIPPERLLLDSDAGSKRSLLTEMISLVPNIDTDQALEVIMAREKLGSTGIGHGVAIPHGRLEELDKPIIAIVRHIAGINFEAIDGQPVHIVILLLAPDNEDQAHLELLAHLARILKNEQVRQAIMHAESAEAVSALFPSLPGQENEQ